MSLHSDPHAASGDADDDAASAPGIGHNGPPVSAADAHARNMDDLFDEARQWLEGRPAASQGEIDAIDRLQDMVRDAVKAADASRKAEAKPFDDGKAAVQALYKPIIENGERIVAACRAAKLPLLAAQQSERDRVAREARASAEIAARAAREAAAVSTGGADLNAVVRRDALIERAEEADKVARRAEKPKAKGFRSYWDAAVVDRRAALGHMAKTDPEGLVAMIAQWGQRRVNAGERDLPGFEVRERQVAL